MAVHDNTPATVVYVANNYHGMLQYVIMLGTSLVLYRVCGLCCVSEFTLIIATCLVFSAQFILNPLFMNLSVIRQCFSLASRHVISLHLFLLHFHGNHDTLLLYESGTCNDCNFPIRF